MIIAVSVVSIDGQAFEGCNDISTVIYNGTNDPCRGNKLFSSFPDSVAFLCVSEDYEHNSSFCGVSNLLRSNECQDLFEGHHPCSIVVNRTVQKKADVILWENKSAGCLEYYCDNNTGLRVRSLCSSNEETLFVCVNDTCIDYIELNEKQKVEIDFEGLNITDWNTTEAVDRISDMSGVDPDEFQIMIKFDEENAQVVQIIVLVDSEETAKRVSQAITKCQK